jgi:hypothetical protein
VADPGTSLITHRYIYFAGTLALILASASRPPKASRAPSSRPSSRSPPGNHNAARRPAELIAEHGNPSRREAFAIRLRAFASHQPSPSPALDVAEIIAPENRQA